MMTTRRDLLRNTFAGTLALGTWAPGLARAAGEDYKALVCVMLHGGMDSHDCIIPTGSDYSDWASQRRGILNQWEGGSRAQSSILPLSGTSVGLAPELGALRPLYDRQDLALVANVGPLEEPATRQQVRDKTVRMPFKLASHNDQLSMWTANAPDGAPTGWGGRMLDQLGQGSDLAGISFEARTAMVSGELSPGVTISGTDIRKPLAVADASYVGSDRLPALLRQHYENAAAQRGNILLKAAADQQRRALDASVVLNEAVQGATAGDPVRAGGNPLADQLGRTADLIASRSALGCNRQIFFVQMGGFDTHADHASRMPGLQQQLAEALSRFQGAIDGMGMADNVTTFTISDFGRTLANNSSGTDHGWGAHHFVMGGAVRGGRVFGSVTPYALGHDQDWQRGAMIPTMSVEQFGSDLGRWFGLTNSQLRAVFPNYDRFDPLGDSLFV